MRFVLVLAMAIMGPDLVQSEQSYADKANNLVDSYVRSDLFSGSILVARGDQLLFRKAFGLADREWDIPNTPQTKFRIGSVTKQFTATAILQLVERGQLKLDDPISKYYTNAPSFWQKVTIQHLLTHTSGIPSYTLLPDFRAKIAKIDRTPKEIIDLTRDQPLEFEPGTAFAYDNTGYILLGYVIEKLSRHSYAQYLQKNIFGPLGMNNTGYDLKTTIIPHRASGYTYYNQRWENASYIAMSLPFAAGGLYSTVDDLLVWEQSLSKVLSLASLQAMFADYGNGYGFGRFIRNQFDRRLQTHGGRINGFRANVDLYPDDKLTVIVLSNSDIAPVERIAHELAALQFGIAKTFPNEVLADPALLEGYAGYYRLGPKFVLHVSCDGSRLFVQATKQPKLQVFPENDRVFFYKVAGAKISFEVDQKGSAKGLILHQNGRDLPAPRIDGAEAARIAEEQPKEHKGVPINPKLLDGYVGHYQVGPRLILTISKDGGRVFARATGLPRIEIYPEGDQDFFLKVIDAQITFETNDHGRAFRLVLHLGGLDVPAPRME